LREPFLFQASSLIKQSAYASPELETLAFVWATKYFRCYLYGKQFLVITDHAALNFLRNFADPKSHNMRWSLSLSQLEFEIEHVTGSKIKQVDALSRHVGLVVVTQLISKDLMLREQKNSICKAKVQNRLTTQDE